MESTAVVRDGTPADSFALAVLRFRDLGRHPETTPDAVGELAAAMEQWMRDHDQKQNIGRMLIDRLSGKARELGLSRVSLHSSAAAIPFYASLGFRASERLLQRASYDENLHA